VYCHAAGHWDLAEQLRLFSDRAWPWPAPGIPVAGNYPCLQVLVQLVQLRDIELHLGCGHFALK